MIGHTREENERFLALLRAREIAKPTPEPGQFILVIEKNGTEAYKGQGGPIVHRRGAVRRGWETFDEAGAAADRLVDYLHLDAAVSIERRLKDVDRD